MSQDETKAAPVDARAALTATLEAGWSRVARVEGPALDDRAAPLAERSRAFAARLRAFFPAKS